MLILGESHLRAVPIEYQVHYSAARPHGGIAQSVPDELHAPSATVTGLDTERIRRRSVLNGLIDEYTRACGFYSRGLPADMMRGCPRSGCDD